MNVFRIVYEYFKMSTAHQVHSILVQKCDKVRPHGHESLRSALSYVAEVATNFHTYYLESLMHTKNRIIIIFLLHKFKEM